MLENFSSNFIKYLKYKGYPPKDEVLFKYGFNIFCRYLALILVLSVILSFIGDIKYILVFDFIVVIMRFHCGGYHLKSAMNCFVVSLLVLSIIPKLVLKIQIVDFYIISLLVLSVIFLCFIKPKSNEKKQVRDDLINRIEKRKNKLLILISSLSLVLYCIDPIYIKMVAFALLFIITVVIIDRLKKDGGENYGRTIQNV